MPSTTTRRTSRSSASNEQADYLKTTAEKYFACDPTVTDVELFLLGDEPTRNGRSQDGSTVLGGGWQSGLLTAGGQGVAQPKPAYSQLGADFAAGRGACKGARSCGRRGAPTGSTVEAGKAHEPFVKKTKHVRHTAKPKHGTRRSRSSPCSSRRSPTRICLGEPDGSPRHVLDRLRAADVILHAGDFSALSVLEELRLLATPSTPSTGTRRAALRELLPKELVVDAGGARGSSTFPAPGREERLVRRFPGCDAVLYGHTHLPQVERHERSSGSSIRDRRPSGDEAPSTRCCSSRSPAEPFRPSSCA